MPTKKGPSRKKTQVPLTPSEEILLLKDNITETLRRLRIDFENIKIQYTRSMRIIDETMMACFEKIKTYHTQVIEVKCTNENVEQTLLNVLLAIRQNEYLQAWYPAQQGHPEQKVIGAHPLQQDNYGRHQEKETG